MLAKPRARTSGVWAGAVAGLRGTSGVCLAFAFLRNTGAFAEPWLPKGVSACFRLVLGLCFNGMVGRTLLAAPRNAFFRPGKTFLET